MDLSFLQYPFMERALLAGGIAGLVCPVLGVFIVLRGVAFVGEGISHAAFAGVALGILFGVPPLVAALLFCSLVSILIAFVSERGGIREDAGTGVLFSSSVALGVLLLSTTKRGGAEVMAYLFGSILDISPSDLYFSSGLCLVTLIVTLLFYKELMTVVFDEELAGLLGLSARFFTYLLFLLIALAVVACLRLVGIILVSSLLITPAATALQFAKDFDRAVLLASILGVVTTESGLVLSYFLDTPPGATIALISTGGFLLSVLGKSVAQRTAARAG